MTLVLFTVLIHLAFCTNKTIWEHVVRYIGPKNPRSYAVWKQEDPVDHGTSRQHSIFTG